MRRSSEPQELFRTPSTGWGPAPSSARRRRTALARWHRTLAQKSWSIWPWSCSSSAPARAISQTTRSCANTRSVHMSHLESGIGGRSGSALASGSKRLGQARSALLGSRCQQGGAWQGQAHPGVGGGAGHLFGAQVVGRPGQRTSKGHCEQHNGAGCACPPLHRCRYAIALRAPHILRSVWHHEPVAELLKRQRKPP